MQLSYEKKENYIFEINPVIKLTYYVGLLILSFLYDHPVYLAMIFIFILYWSSEAKILPAQIKFIKFSLILSIFYLIVVTLLNENGQTILWSFPTDIPLIGDIIITLETIIYGLIYIFRFVIVFLTFMLINLTVDPDDLMKILLKLHLPYVLVLIIIMTLRFFPVLLQDLNTISEVQQSRGYELDQGNKINKAKRRMTLILPLLSNSLERSIQASEALEARGFNAASKRTHYKELEVDTQAALLRFFIILGFVLLIILRGIGYGSYMIYPIIIFKRIDQIDLLIFAIWFLSTFFLIQILKKTPKSTENLLYREENKID